MFLKCETTLNAYVLQNKTILCRIKALPSNGSKNNNEDAVGTCRAMTPDQWNAFDAALKNWLGVNENMKTEELDEGMCQFDVNTNLQVKLRSSKLAIKDFLECVRSDGDDEAEIDGENCSYVVDCILEYKPMSPISSPEPQLFNSEIESPMPYDPYTPSKRNWLIHGCKIKTPGAGFLGFEPIDAALLPKTENALDDRCSSTETRISSPINEVIIESEDEHCRPLRNRLKSKRKMYNTSEVDVPQSEQPKLPLITSSVDPVSKECKIEMLKEADEVPKEKYKRDGEHSLRVSPDSVVESNNLIADLIDNKNLEEKNVNSSIEHIPVTSKDIKSEYHTPASNHNEFESTNEKRKRSKNKDKNAIKIDSNENDTSNTDRRSTSVETKYIVPIQRSRSNSITSSKEETFEIENSEQDKIKSKELENACQTNEQLTPKRKKFDSIEKSQLISSKTKERKTSNNGTKLASSKDNITNLKEDTSFEDGFETESIKQNTHHRHYEEKKNSKDGDDYVTDKRKQKSHDKDYAKKQSSKVKNIVQKHEAVTTDKEKLEMTATEIPPHRKCSKEKDRNRSSKEAKHVTVETKSKSHSFSSCEEDFDVGGNKIKTHNKDIKNKEKSKAKEIDNVEKLSKHKSLKPSVEISASNKKSTKEEDNTLPVHSTRRSDRSPSKPKRYIEEQEKYERKKKSPKSSSTKHKALFGTDDDDENELKGGDTNNNGSRGWSHLQTPKSDKKSTSLTLSSSSSSSAKKKRKRSDCEHEKSSMKDWLGKKGKPTNSLGRTPKEKSSTSKDKSSKKLKTDKKEGKIARCKTVTPEHMDIIMPSMEELQKMRHKNKQQLEENEKVKADLEQKQFPVPKEVEHLSLKDMTLQELLDTFPEYQKDLDCVFEKNRKKDHVKGHDGVNHCLVIGLVDQRYQFKMLEKLSDIYNNSNSTAQATLYANALLPEWIIRVYMNKYSFNRHQAIEQIEGQDAYRSYIEGQNDDMLLDD